MAASPPKLDGSRPLPRRVSSAAAASVQLRSPSPMLRSDSRSTISRLERSAEEMSQGGSDVHVEHEIRRMNELEREQSRSRQNSIQSSHQGEGLSLARPDPSRGNSGRSRTSSYANSIVDVNTTARWGGYSPSGVVTSPTGSVLSGDAAWTSSLNRVTSGPSVASKSSRLAQMVEPMQEGRPLDSPLAPSSASMYSQEHQMSRQASQSSFAQRYDAIAGQIEESLQTIPPTPSPPVEDHESHGNGIDRPQSTDTFQEAQIAFKDFDGVHYNPDTEEYVELDDEGHELRRVSARTSSGSFMDAASILRTPRAQEQQRHYGAPPPRDSMVYYPAPVPRMLNLPKRLSQQPAAHVQAKRRSQMLKDLPANSRQSAPWIPPISFSEGEAGHLATERNNQDVRSEGEGRGRRSESDSMHEHPRPLLNERMSMHNPQNLPPQLRASLFFQHQSIPHDIEIQSESAVATLDQILAASATAPVNAFTDHPYAGDVRKTVYAQERPHQRRSTATTLQSLEKDKKVKKKRSSSIGNFFRRKSTDLDGELEEGDKSRPASSGSMLDLNADGGKLKKRRSQMSMGSIGDQLEQADRSTTSLPLEETSPERRRRSSGLIDQAINAEPQADYPSHESRPETAMRQLTEAEQIDQDFRDAEAEEDYDVDDDPVFAQPTTLLAELQVRKAQLKSRNKTAATAFPTGMHSTLLQLDAVEQINQKKRKQQRVALAWEDPEVRAREDAARDEVDEDVPLGVLFPSKDGLVNKKLGDSRDWNRPLGLMERRAMEDNEPLAARRTRLNPNAVPMKKAATMSNLHLAGQPDMAPEKEGEETDEHEGETLGQRLQRLKTKAALDSTVSGVVPKDGERPQSSFTDDVLDQFPELNLKDNGEEEKRASTESKKGKQTAAGAEQEEETLGQRRARLQREREASGEAPASGSATRPALKSSQSLANLLSSNPVGQRAIMNSRDLQAAQGTLLHTANQAQMKQRQDLANTNMRSVSHHLDRPLVDSRPKSQINLSGGLLGAERSRPSNGGFMPSSTNVVANPFGQSRSREPGGLLGAQRSRPANGGFAGGAFNSTAAGVVMPSSHGAFQQNTAHTAHNAPMFGMPSTNAYFASPTAAMGVSSNYGYFPPQPQQQMNVPAYYALSGAQPAPCVMMPTGYPPMMTAGPGGYGTGATPMMGMQAGGATYASGLQSQMNGGAGAGAAGMMDPNLDPNQRAAIDRWRMGIA